MIVLITMVTIVNDHLMIHGALRIDSLKNSNQSNLTYLGQQLWQRLNEMLRESHFVLNHNSVFPWRLLMSGSSAHGVFTRRCLLDAAYHDLDKAAFLAVVQSC